jgi:hypothetical protein
MIRAMPEHGNPHQQNHSGWPAAKFGRPWSARLSVAISGGFGLCNCFPIEIFCPANQTEDLASQEAEPV